MRYYDFAFLADSDLDLTKIKIEHDNKCGILDMDPIQKCLICKYKYELNFCNFRIIFAISCTFKIRDINLGLQEFQKILKIYDYLLNDPEIDSESVKLHDYTDCRRDPDNTCALFNPSHQVVSISFNLK